MQKVPGVTSVRVSLNEGLTVLELAPENAVTLAGLRQIIRNNGFVTNESRVVLRGTVVASSNPLTFEIRGSKERLLLKAALGAAAGADVVVSGVADTRDPKAMTLSVSKVENP